MVWIENELIVRQYFNELVEARRMAVMWLENNPRAKEFPKVYFYENGKSRNYSGYVAREDSRKVGHYYYWYHYNKYGMTHNPLYKNGKIQR